MTTTKQKITPHLWYDKEAVEAAKFYTSIFPDLKVTHITTLYNTPSGSADIVSFELLGQSFMAISAGPLFQLNPSISFFVYCKSKDQVDALWEKLSQGGVALMELGEYPFSERFGWIQDRYGLSWQLIYVNVPKSKQSITPVLLFVGDVCGKAEEAINFYASVFSAKDKSGASKVDQVTRYGKGEGPEQEGTLQYGTFRLFDHEFGAMDSALKHNFRFNEAISLIVPCETQEEIDYFWDKLSADPEAEACGWLKDKYGVSWQITPAAMDEMMAKGSREQIDRLTQAFLPMKKFDLAQLKKAYEG